MDFYLEMVSIMNYTEESSAEIILLTSENTTKILFD